MINKYKQVSESNLEDVKRIKDYIYKRGIDIPLHEVEELWEDFSEKVCAGWLGVNDELLAEFFYFIGGEDDKN